MFRLPLIGAALLALTGCPGGLGGPLDPYGYSRRWQYLGEPAPRCAEEVRAAANTLSPCPAGRPLVGYVHFKPPAPFDCGGRLVWGCSEVQVPWVAAKVALPASGHAADSAMPEEIAHWTWARCFPDVVTEWEEADLETGRVHFKRDPAFQSWFNQVKATARKTCP